MSSILVGATKNYNNKKPLQKILKSSEAVFDFRGSCVYGKVDSGLLNDMRRWADTLMGKICMTGSILRNLKVKESTLLRLERKPGI